MIPPETVLEKLEAAMPRKVAYLGRSATGMYVFADNKPFATHAFLSFHEAMRTTFAGREVTGLPASAEFDFACPECGAKWPCALGVPL